LLDSARPDIANLVVAMVQARDAVERRSWAHPQEHTGEEWWAGNATGLSIQSSDLAGKRLELLREVTPGLRRLAILTNVDYAGAVLEAGEVQDAAQTLGSKW
jgi:hypothetical protein